MRFKLFWNVLGTQLPVEVEITDTKVMDALAVDGKYVFDDFPETAYVSAKDIRACLGDCPYTLLVDLILALREAQYHTWHSSNCRVSTIARKDRYVEIENAILLNGIDGGNRHSRVIDNPHKIQARKLYEVTLLLVKYWRSLCGMDKLPFIDLVAKVLEPQLWFVTWADALSRFEVETHPREPEERLDSAILQHYHNHVAVIADSVVRRAMGFAADPSRRPVPKPKLLKGELEKPQNEQEQEDQAVQPEKEWPAAEPVQLQVVPEGGVMDKELGGRTHAPIKGHAFVIYELVFDASKAELEGCLALVKGKVPGCEISLVNENVLNVEVEADIVDGWPACDSEIKDRLRSMHWKADTVYSIVWRLLQTARAFDGGTVH